jgi:hypothetical protein
MLNQRKTLLSCLVAGSSIFFGHSSASAAVIINAVQSGSDVVFSYSGSLDITGFNPIAGINSTGSPPAIIPGGGWFRAGLGNGLIYVGNYNLVPYGSGNNGIGADSSTGDYFGLEQTGQGNAIFLPNPYTGNILGSMTFNNKNFSDLGLSPGSYTTFLPNDTVIMNIGAVPAPLPLLGLGAATAFSRKLKQRIAVKRKRDEVGAAV